MSDEAQTQFQDDTTAESGIDKSQIMLVVLVVLAVVASVVMLFSNSATAMKIAVLAALWAAFIGLFLVAKYRRLATEERERSEQQLHALEAELRAEQAELASQKAVEASAQDTELLREIRQQLAELREHLEELSGRDLTYAPATLTAEASRIRELETVTEKAAAAVHEPVEEVEVVEESGADRFDTGSFAVVDLTAGTEKEPEPVFEPEPEPEPAPVAQEERPSHGRRRRDENEGAISVAELLANLKKNS
ncbi:DUF6779 domain-containing protein [Corynebacterium sp. H130]|uniref:DUF6779 domain-containing protein n=1 Tax=Corynebacterium sp. H130 TaxID=3133444 RepID=UPI0030A73CC5